MRIAHSMMQWDCPKAPRRELRSTSRRSAGSTRRLRSLFDRLRHGASELNDVEIEPKSGIDDVRTLLVNARRLRSPDGEYLILLALQDITERKRQAEARYRRLFESARDGI